MKAAIEGFRNAGSYAAKPHVLISQELLLQISSNCQFSSNCRVNSLQTIELIIPPPSNSLICKWIAPRGLYLGFPQGASKNYVFFLTRLVNYFVLPCPPIPELIYCGFPQSPRRDSFLVPAEASEKSSTKASNKIRHKGVCFHKDQNSKHELALSCVVLHLLASYHFSANDLLSQSRLTCSLWKSTFSCVLILAA